MKDSGNFRFQVWYSSNQYDRPIHSDHNTEGCADFLRWARQQGNGPDLYSVTDVEENTTVSATKFMDAFDAGQNPTDLHDL